MAKDSKWYNYNDLLDFQKGNWVIKPREKLLEEGWKGTWFAYRQIYEGFRLDEKTYGFVRKEDDPHLGKILALEENKLISKTYKTLLQYGTEEEVVKHQMIQWARSVGHPILFSQWERVWKNGFRYTASQNLRENFINGISHQTN